VELEKELLSQVSVDDGWEIVEKFNSIVRESGSEGERQAMALLTEKLDSYGVDYKLHTPILFVSLPRSATLQVLGPNERTLQVKTPSMSKSTAPGFVTAELVYISSGLCQRSLRRVCGHRCRRHRFGPRESGLDRRPSAACQGDGPHGGGAAAVVFISPGERIHEGICTNIWGSPDLDSISRKPDIPVVSVKKSDGLWLKDEIRKGTVKVQIGTELEEGWKPVSVLVAEIKGSVEPEKFILVHGHLDSWHVGISDNATGDATLLELARVSQEVPEGPPAQRADCLVVRSLSRPLRRLRLVRRYVRPGPP
jgi:N-acetylated-alpha-linked acidic dipeptidase